ncbi:MAG: BatA domain-containing protein [Reichenbachiella sp.]|uniref:BatA domain-containing protein n=3 Tax=Reichenbachiella sp. TaxID=2184521 RepID=UPI00326363C3
MSFIYPIFLWGLTALAIPIIVHLFNFRKAKKISFSNVRFLESVKKKSSSNLRIRHLLILLCRLLFIFFLILTFAQPVIPSKEDGLRSKSVAIYLDNSNSLSNLTVNDVSGFNEILSVAQEITLLYSSETKFSLITNDFLPGSHIGRSKNKTSEKLTEIEYSNLSRNGKEIFSKLRAGDPNEIKDVFVLTDFQQSTFGDLSLFKDSINFYHLVATDLLKSKNISVDTVFLTNPFLVPNQKNSVRVRIKNQGSEINDLHVKFLINGRQSGTSSIDIGANDSKEIVFELTGGLTKLNRCQISFEDFPISFDNDYYFALNQAGKINIVEIFDTFNNPISQVYKNNDLFNFTSFHLENISYPVLESADLIIINGLPTLENGLKAQIEKQLELGKSVLFIPKGGEFAEYEFAGLRIIKDSVGVKTPLNVPDVANPFYENIFESLSSDTQMPLVSSIYNWPNRDITLLRTKTGHSYLSRISHTGNLYLLASPLTSIYTNFHQHALFVPVMHRIAELSGSNNQPLAYSVDETNISLTVDSIPSGQLYKLMKEDGELIPSQRIKANELLLDMPKYLLSPGYYDLMLGGQRISALAFNHSKKESELKTWPIEEIEAQLSGIQHLQIYQSQDARAFSKIMKEKYHQRELWKYALVLSLIFLFAESVLLRFL